MSCSLFSLRVFLSGFLPLQPKMRPVYTCDAPGRVKGQSHEILNFRFFHQTASPECIRGNLERYLYFFLWRYSNSKWKPGFSVTRESQHPPESLFWIEILRKNWKTSKPLWGASKRARRSCEKWKVPEVEKGVRLSLSGFPISQKVYLHTYCVLRSHLVSI